MKGEIDIINALTVMLRKNFPAIEIKDADEAEGFDRACFAVEILSAEDGQIGEMEELNTSVNLYYFCHDIYSGYLELLRMKKNLSKLLRQPIEITDNFLFTCDDVGFTISRADKALAVNFNVKLVQDYEKDTEFDCYMEKLIIGETEV